LTDSLANQPAESKDLVVFESDDRCKIPRNARSLDSLLPRFARLNLAQDDRHVPPEFAGIRPNQ